MTSKLTTESTDLSRLIGVIRVRDRRDGAECDYGIASCIAAFGSSALFITASHIIEGILWRDDNRSDLFFVRSDQLRHLEVVLRMSNGDGTFEDCIVATMIGRAPYDTAAMWVSSERSDRFATPFNIDTRVPRSGTAVVMLGCRDLTIDCQPGLVTHHMTPEDMAVRSNGYIIGTNVPVDSGQSGSPLLDSATMAVLGIASRDESLPGDPAKGAGKSKFTPILPVLALGIPEGITLPDSLTRRTNEPVPFFALLDLLKWGKIGDIGNCLPNITVQTYDEKRRLLKFGYEGVIPPGRATPHFIKTVLVIGPHRVVRWQC